MHNIPLFEYAGRSTEVLRLSYVAYELMFSEYKVTRWEEYGNGVYCKEMRIDTSNNAELNKYIDGIEFNVYLLPEGMSKSDLGVDSSSRVYPYEGEVFLEINSVMRKGDDIRNVVFQTVEHEMMHAFKIAKRGGKVKMSNLYFNATRDGEIDETLTNNQKDAKSIIKNLPYFFEKEEIEANVQEMWGELVRCGDYTLCPTFRDEYSRAFRYYNIIKTLYDRDDNEEVSREFISNVIINDLKIPPSYYFRTIRNGIRKFKTSVGKMIARYNDNAQ